MEAAELEFLERLDRVVRATLGSSHVGTYVHGSVALGGFVPKRSDVDVLFVVDGIDAVDATRLGAALVATSWPCPGRGLEASVVSSAAAAAPTARWPFVLHVNTEASHEVVVVGADSDGDSDLLMHYVVARVAAIALNGPPAATVFGDVPRSIVLGYLVEELNEALLAGSRAYALLNACRAWRYLETGDVVSKIAGGAWARSRIDDPRIIESALGEQTGERIAHSLDQRDEQFVASVIERLHSGGGISHGCPA